MRSFVVNKLMTAIVVVAASLVLIALPSPARAQSASALTGTWALLSSTTERDGNKIYNFGAKPQGKLVIDKAGNWITVITKPDLPKFASNNYMSGTADENKAIAQGILAYFGKYTVNPANHTITVTIQSASVPNWNGQVQKRAYELVGDQLTLIANPALGGGIARMVWKRAQ
jgi:hypothetical protein